MNVLKMKAIIVSAYGAPNVLQVQTVNKPIPQAHELLVKIKATPVTAADGMMRKGTPRYARLFLGWSKPKIPISGTCFSGIVEGVGSQVSQFEVGDTVVGETGIRFSANAEYCCVDENAVIVKKPKRMSFEEAAPLCDGALTSLNFLKNLGQIQTGQRVLINGASGGLGTAAIQLAKHYGAHVTGVCSTRNIDFVQSLGADEVIDYTKKDFTDPNDYETSSYAFDLVFDTVGKSTFRQCKRVLKPKGIYLSPVLGISLLLQMLWTRLFKGKRVKFAATGLAPTHKLKEMLEEICWIVDAKHLITTIDKRYTLAEAAEAHTYVDKGHKRGNVVLVL